MLSVRDCSLFYGSRPLLDSLSFDVAPGEIVTLMGPSGVGKSTFLNWMIGALPPSFTASGELWLNDSRRDTLPVERRRIGILFQDALLFPHLSVGQNLQMAIPKDLKGRQLAEQALESAGLAGYASRDPATLSGGERARVSVLRALLARPEALLLDEPFSRLDRDLRAQFRQFISDNIAGQALPVVLVTHDAQDIPPGGKIITL
ncbi:ATP-binding cassette domain-containing protein [Dryocola clanedunensis]|uniref:ATP-binding cassette domain-containing protein n=1 Tax=Cedecea sulfonylureivorans TaxID=3051154 RepID=UPI001926FFB5|nr:ATP-binding cassette domain-containing protein [Cedecea sulfonylureivorans]